MNAPLYVTPASPVTLPDLPPGVAETNGLLRTLLDTQREQLALMRSQLAAQDQGNKWRAFLARWADEFPDAGAGCKQALPALERTFLALLRELTDKVKDLGDDLGDEFVLNEFLDRYGTRVGQLATIINQVGPLAEAAPAPAEAGERGA